MLHISCAYLMLHVVDPGKIKHFSIVYVDYITVFKALLCRAYIVGQDSYALCRLMNIGTAHMHDSSL